MSTQHQSLVDRIYSLPNEGGRFAAMEGLRAWAALLVFLVHYFDAWARGVWGLDLNTLTLGTAEDAASAAMAWLFASHYGVDIFFFLSGFLIYKLVSRTSFSYFGFAGSRIKRVYPTFLVSFLIWLYIRTGLQAVPLDPTQLLGNLFFLNAVPALGVKPYNAVTWSLFYEFAFYLSFPLVLSLRRPAGRIGPWQIMLFGALMVWLMMSMGPWFIRFMMFFGGAVMASIRRERLVEWAERLPDILALGAFIGSTTWFAWHMDYVRFIPVFVVTTFGFVLKVLYGTGFLNQVFSLRWLRYMGNISYSFYLMHGLAIEVVMVQFFDVFSALSGAVLLLATFGSALLLAVLLSTGLFLLTEKPYFTRKSRQQVVAQPVETPA